MSTPEMKIRIPRFTAQPMMLWPDFLGDDDEQKQEVVVQLLAAREDYEQRVRDEPWRRNWQLMDTLTGSGLRPMALDVAALALEQASLDTSIKVSDIPCANKAQNIAYLSQAVFERENEHLFLRSIMGVHPAHALRGWRGRGRG